MDRGTTLSEPASRANDLTGNPSSVFTCQKGDQASYIFGLSYSSHRKARQEFSFHLFGHLSRIGGARIDRVDRDSSWRDFYSQRDGEGLDGSLGGDIG